MSRHGLTQMLPMRLPTLACRYRGVSKKKGKWEAKVMVNRRWAYRELFDRCDAGGGLAACRLLGAFGSVFLLPARQSS